MSWRVIRERRDVTRTRTRHTFAILGFILVEMRIISNLSNRVAGGVGISAP